jgi:phage FluMu protein Com
MVQTITCDTCNKTVFITDVQDVADFDKKYLSCGHMKIDNRALLENSVISQMTSSDPIMCSKCNTTYANDSQYMIHYNQKTQARRRKSRKIFLFY